MIYILNSFSPSMFEEMGIDVYFEPINISQLRKFLKEQVFFSAVDQPTAELLSKILGIEVKCGNREIKLYPGDRGIVLGRPEDELIKFLDRMHAYYFIVVG